MIDKSGFSIGNLEFKPAKPQEDNKSTQIIQPINPKEQEVRESLKGIEENSKAIIYEEFDINSLILKTLEPIGVPVYFAARKEEKLPLILFNVTGERGVEFLDDEETIIRYKISVNIFSRGNYLPIKKQVMKRMKDAGFIRTDVPSCIYEESVDLYNQPIFFNFYKIFT